MIHALIQNLIFPGKSIDKNFLDKVYSPERIEAHNLNKFYRVPLKNMNHAEIKLQPIIEEFNEISHILDLIYIFSDIDILPMPDDLGFSPYLLQMYSHIWRETMLSMIQLSIQAGLFIDAEGASVMLEEDYWLDSIIPSGIIPNHQIALASVVDVDGFLATTNQMYVFTSFKVRYRGKSETFPTPPAQHIKVPGRGISPYNDTGGWFIPNLAHFDFDSDGLLLGTESHTPSTSGFTAWYNDGGGMLLIFHPSLINAVLRSNLPNTAYGEAPDLVWTKELLSTQDPYPACIPLYSVLSSDMNEHFIQYYCENMRFERDSITPNHVRGAWASSPYDWETTISSYFSHSDHGGGCPFACESCHRYAGSFGSSESRRLVSLEWILNSYGRPNTQNRDLYAYVSAVPQKEYFSYVENYLFLDGKRSLDLITKENVVSEWNATGFYSYPAYTHYGGLVGSIRINDMILLDRANYFLSSGGITGGNTFSASPINYFRNFRHTGNRRDGTLYILGYVIPDDYTVYYRPDPTPISITSSIHELAPFLEDIFPGLDIIKDDSLIHKPIYNKENFEYSEEEVTYL